MSIKDFRVLESLGKGSFASVYKVIRKSDNKVYALKRVKINKMSKKEIADALNEIRFLASIRHKNIVGFLEAFLESNESELCIVMEFCGCGDLAQKVERYKRRRQYIDEDVLWRYLIQCLKALQCLHENGICHRDLKVANTFIAEDGSVKIGDMNVSKRLKNGHLQTQIGTPYYMSPEIWNNRPYDFSSDMWSLGCMMYELATLKPPFLGDSFPQLKRAVTAGKYQPLSRKYTDGLHRVIAQMLKVNPRERPTAEALLRSSDLAAKLQLDELAVSQAQQRSREAAHMKLMETIKVPQNLRQLGLPKPCYPDVRPNSPKAWPDFQQQKPSARPPAPPILETHHEDENMAPESCRDEHSARHHHGGGRPHRDPSVAQLAPIKAGDGHAPSRRPGAPLDSNVPPSSRYPDSSAYPQKVGGGPSVAASAAPPLVSQAPGLHNRGHARPHAPAAGGVPVPPPASARAPGQPGRPQYQHRMW